VRWLLYILMIRRPPRSTRSRSSAASDGYKRRVHRQPSRRRRGSAPPRSAAGRTGREPRVWPCGARRAAGSSTVARPRVGDGREVRRGCRVALADDLAVVRGPGHRVDHGPGRVRGELDGHGTSECSGLNARTAPAEPSRARPGPRSTIRSVPRPRRPRTTRRPPQTRSGRRGGFSLR